MQSAEEAFNGNEPVAASPQNLVSRLPAKRPNMGGIVEDQARLQAKPRRETAAKQSEDKCLEPDDTDASREAHTAAAAVGGSVTNSDDDDREAMMQLDEAPATTMRCRCRPPFGFPVIGPFHAAIFGVSIASVLRTFFSLTSR